MQRLIKTIFGFILFTIILTLYTSDSYAQKEGYELFWQDEFNGTELDMTIWDHRGVGSEVRGGKWMEENAKVDGNGNLILTTFLDSNNYHIGMVGTKGGFNTTYGYFEARVKFGRILAHDAFWMQCATAYEAGPTSETGAEIDIAEYKGRQTIVPYAWDDEGNLLYDTLGYELEHNLHWGDDDGNMTGWGKKSLIQNPNEYMIFALEWTEDRYRFYINDSLTCETASGLSAIDEYVCFSNDPISDYNFPENVQNSVLNGETVLDTFFVDYVRVYKKVQTDVKDSELSVSVYSLKQNYPNPFNPSTTIKYSIPHSDNGSDLSLSNVTLKVYDLLGKEIAVLVNKEQKPGNYSVKFAASELTSGIYFYKLIANNFSQTNKMIVLK